jgi:predicted SprT family Zn-dependent metalloprotease
MTNTVEAVVKLAVAGTNPFVEKLVATRTEAVKLLMEYELWNEGWRFVFSNHQTIVGQCDFNSKRIKFSQHYLMKNDAEFITDTLLHEIAHALVGPNHGHDYTWRRKAIEIGCNGERTCGADVKSTAKPNYLMKCPTCGWHTYRFRMKRRNFGGRCPECHTEIEIFKIDNGR